MITDRYLPALAEKLDLAMHSCLSTTDICPKLKIQYSFMELQILRLIKFSSCRQSFASFPHWWFMGWKSRVHLPYCLSFAHPPAPAFLLEYRFQNEKDVKKKREKITVRIMIGQCQNNSPAVIFLQRSFNMVTEMHIQYSWDRSQELLRWVSCASWWLTGL